MTLKELRIEKGMTQEDVANFFGVSLRSYKSYENEKKKEGTLKYNYFYEKLKEYNTIDEEHGILTLEEIKDKCSSVFNEYNVNYCYLFGSYAKGKATPLSDVDLLISCDVKGLKFYGLVEKLRGILHKKVDLLETKQLNNNLELIEEILKDGVRIYG